MASQNDPLHGVTLKMIVTELQETLGWEELGYRINIKCFTQDPSIKSSLTFLRKTEWARQKVENLYLKMKGHKDKMRFDTPKASKDKVIQEHSNLWLKK